MRHSDTRIDKFTRSGVDTIDQKCSIYCVNRRKGRWLLAIFYFIVASSNTHSCYRRRAEKSSVTVVDTSMNTGGSNNWKIFGENS